MNRNEVFLEAMGLGPQWRLRHAPAAIDADAVADVAGAADGMVAGAFDGAAANAVAGNVPGVMAYAAGDAAGIEQGMAAGSGDESAQSAYAAPAAPAAVAAASGLPPAGSQQEPPVPDGGAARTAGPSAGATAPGGEDTSWFDDAPAAPSTRPALKSPPPAKAPPPARPAGNGASNGAASQADAGGDSYAWFDDVPATPVPRPARKPAPEADASWRDEPPARPKAAAPRQAVPDDGIPWPDDAPLPVFDGDYGDVDGDAYGGAHAGADGAIADAAIARMDWPGLRAAVQSCTRCALCRERSAAVPGRGGESAPWLVLATAPNGDDEAQVRTLAGAPGQLLDNMLKAIGVAPDAQAYVTTLVKCRPRGDRAPSADEVAACRPYLERELALAGSRAIVTLGHTAAKGLLGAAARGKVLRLGDVPVVATYHPADLLRKPEDKAKAWADLCLARSAFDAGSQAAAGGRA